MPYIKKEFRKDLSNFDSMAWPKDIGELNFVLTKIILEYLKEYGESYTTYNEIMGVLECIKQELYRRMIAPYEDEKIQENGDIYNE